MMMDRRAGIKMSIETKMRFQRLKNKYEELVNEDLRDEDFLNILMDIYEKREEYAKYKAVEDLINEFLEKLRLILTDKPKTFNELLREYLKLDEEYYKLKQKFEELNTEYNKLKKEVEKLKQSGSVESLTPRQLFRQIIRKTLEKIQNDKLKEEIEKDLHNLEFALFQGDDINIARVKQILESLKTLRIPLF